MDFRFQPHRKRMSESDMGVVCNLTVSKGGPSTPRPVVQEGDSVKPKEVTMAKSITPSSSHGRSSRPLDSTLDMWIIRMREERQLLDSERDEEILERRCICRVPKYMRSLNKNVYTPRVVSLGPYHHHYNHDCCESAHPYLKNMEPIKRKILLSLLELKGTKLEDVVSVMEEVRELMDAYDALEDPWTDEGRFIELMILDGCFVLANVLAHNRKLLSGDLERSPLRYAMYTLQPVSQEVVADMVLLENQVPFRAVQILAELLTPEGMIGDGGLEAYMIDIVLNDDQKGRRKTSYHMLDLMRQVLLLNDDFIYKGNESMGTVTELIEKGVSFRASLRDVRFSNGVLMIRAFFLEPNVVECLFANTVAYEKMKDLDPIMLSYLGFMDCLIDTAKDVALLRKKRIISGWIGSDEQVAAIFNRLVKQIPSPPPNYRSESRGIDEQVIEYCSKRRHGWWASFKNLYLKNPWVLISMLAGIILLALTVLQAVYEVFGYYKP